MNIRAVIMTALICVHKINKGCKHNLHPSTIQFLLIPLPFVFTIYTDPIYSIGKYSCKQ